MTDSNQIRINELARELEVKAKAIIDYLPEAGVTEKKTHSSSIEVEAAVKVREHFRALANAEVEAEQKAVADKAAKEAAARAARMKPVAAAPPPPVIPPPPAPVVAEPIRPAAPPASVVEAKPAAPAPVVSKPVVVPPAAEPAKISPAPSPVAAKPPAARPPVPAVPPQAPPAAAKPPAPAPAAARHATSPAHALARPAAAARPPAGARPAPAPPKPNWNPLPPGARVNPPAAPRPTATARPGGQPSRFPVRPGQGRPGQPVPGRTGQPLHERPGAPRPGGRSGTLLPPDKAPPKAEPGKPIYERKPAARARPTMEKRFEEGERKLHPVRARMGVGEQRRSAQIERAPAPPPREPRQITITEGVTVRDLAEKLDVRAKDVLKILLDRGIFASINQALDTPTATSLAEAFNGIVNVITFEEDVVREVALEEKPENLLPRPPVVTVMGHVDHGKTSLLDAIRETEVAAGEAGGITQHIGASEVHIDGRKVVFIDTPGHEAFTRMRARGAKVTDIVVLVVAADDGVMPQTQEAIDHAKAAGVPIIVAINKIDKPEAQPERVKRQLSDRGLMPEDWGGDTVMVEVSAKQKKNVDKLLEMLLLVADLRDLRANPESPASGTVLESRVDKGRGPVATVLVQGGTLHTGDVFICGAVYGKVRAMFDEHGRVVTQAGPSTPVEVLGLQGAPEAGDQFQVTDEARARHIVEF